MRTRSERSAASLGNFIVSLLLLLQVPTRMASQTALLSEMQPDSGDRGGRAVAVDVNPFDANMVIVGSEFGGLFKSIDDGSSWSHIETFGKGLPLDGLVDVRFAPWDPRVVFATVADDSAKVEDPAFSGGGIWRSMDSGETWTHVSPGPCGRYGAAGITFLQISTRNGAVLIGTSCGLAVSEDLGATWSVPLGGLDVISVAAGWRPVPPAPIPIAPTAAIYVCAAGGSLGIWKRLDENGNGWIDLAAGPNCPGPHSLALSPYDPRVVFAIAGNSMLESDDEGRSWIDLNSAADRVSDPGRPKWVKTRAIDDGAFDLYNSGLRQSCSRDPQPNSGLRCSNQTSAWLSVPDSGYNHDLLDIAFSPTGNCPQFMVGDFGILRADPVGATTCTRGRTWSMTGNGSDGYNALEIYQVAGQVDTTGGFTNLYFGTGPVPNRVEMRKAHSSGGRTTTESPPARAVGGMRRGQAYQEAAGC